MRLLQEPLETITANDIAQLCSDQVSESTELELKSDLPCKAGQQADPWHAGKSFGDYARNQITEEIIAFANTLGGVVCIGIEESTDHPKRAKAPSPLPRVHDLARRLRQAVYDNIDPPLPILEACGIELGANGQGVVLLRVPPSRRRPHRHQVNKEVFVRRADESVRVSMREIQELTLQSISDITKIDATIDTRRKKYRGELYEWLRVGSVWGCGLHIVAVPTTPMELGRVAGRPTLTNFPFGVVADFGKDNQHQCPWPFMPTTAWRPGLRSISATFERTDRQGAYPLQTDGVAELTLNIRATDERPGIFAGWLIGGIGYMLAWIERMRSEAGAYIEFALAVQLPVFGHQIELMRYGAGDFSGIDSGGHFLIGQNEFPIMSVGPIDEFNELIKRFDEDIWNLAGQDIQLTSADFKFSRS
jgi:hypothetical protein